MADPAVTLTVNPPGPKYVIDEQCGMPAITAVAALQNISPDTRVPVQYQWSATVEFQGSTDCPHSVSRTTSHAAITELNGTAQFRIPFTQVRGGSLTVKLTVVFGNITLQAKTTGLTITGTNPTLDSLKNAAPARPGFRKPLRLQRAAAVHNERLPAVQRGQSGRRWIMPVDQSVADGRSSVELEGEPAGRRHPLELKGAGSARVSDLGGPEGYGLRRPGESVQRAARRRRGCGRGGGE